MGTGGGLRLQAPQCQPGTPKELISVGSLLLIPLASRQQGLPVDLCVPAPGLGAVSTIQGVSCLFWDIQYMSTMWVTSLGEIVWPFQQGPWKVVGVGGVVREGCLERKGMSSSFEDLEQMAGGNVHSDESHKVGMGMEERMSTVCWQQRCAPRG